MNRRSAFTLVELMIVMAIIGLLSATLFPYLSRYTDRARDSERRSSTEVIALALQNFMLENSTWTKIDGGKENSNTGYVDVIYNGTSIAGNLEEKGFLQRGVVTKVDNEADGLYMLGGCNGMTFSVATRLILPTAVDKEKIFYACDGIDGTTTNGGGMYKDYKMNYASTRGDFCVPRAPQAGSLYNCMGQDIFAFTGSND